MSENVPRLLDGLKTTPGATLLSSEQERQQRLTKATWTRGALLDEVGFLLQHDPPGLLSTVQAGGVIKLG